MTHAFRHIERGYLTDQERAKLFLDKGGRCDGPCGRKLGPADVWHADHRVALENGGTNEITNFQVLCSWCHKPKTAEDHGKAAKTRAIAVRHIIPTTQRRGKGPPMPGSRQSAYKKKMDGTVVRRNQG